MAIKTPADSREVARKTRSGPVSRPRRRSDTLEKFAILGDVLKLVWRRKLWWLAPLLVALFLLSLLLMLQATPVGPLLYPLF